MKFYRHIQGKIWWREKKKDEREIYLQDEREMKVQDERKMKVRDEREINVELKIKN